jgi:squalene-hopene/tetraprenyl-beta-curcumene cyclase
MAGITEATGECLQRGVGWLLDATCDGTHFPVSPIGLYFARLWYHEKLYPIIWTLGALKATRAAL